MLHKLLLILLVLAAGSLPSFAREKVIYSFTEGTGADYYGALLSDSAGNLYGTTKEGGGSPNCTKGCGTVYALLPTNGQWTQKILHSFNFDDGSYPGARLIFDSAGNLYGTTGEGGTGNCSGGGCGLVFELTPNPDGTWTETVLFNFQGGNDGAHPGGLAFDKSGNLYGTLGMSFGAVFQLAPPRQPEGAWSESVIYAFQGNPDGQDPNAAITVDAAGNLYGTTFHGGGRGYCEQGCGTVYKLKRVNGQWKELLYKFPGGGNGFGPQGSLIRDAEGTLYGTLAYGGNSGGAVFKLKRVNGQWQETMLYNFCSRDYCADGQQPNDLVFDQAGNLYGTTLYGGLADCPSFGCGIAFRLTPAKPTWKEAVLHKFGRSSEDGLFPNSNLVLDAKGNLYGSTLRGGTASQGTIFKIIP